MLVSDLPSLFLIQYKMAVSGNDHSCKSSLLALLTVSAYVTSILVPKLRVFKEDTAHKFTLIH